MPTLHEVQQAVRRSLLRDEDAHALPFVVRAGLAPELRVGIYRNTILGALTNALRLSFPAVDRLVGAEFFEGVAQLFAREEPPGCADLNVFGAEFPDFLEHFEPVASLAYLPDVARLEWAVNRALHACDAPALNLSQLAAIEFPEQDRVSFAAHPSISMLRSNFPVDTIWDAVLRQDDSAMSAIELASGPVCLMVERLAAEVKVLRLGEGAWRFSAALFSGQALRVALGAALGIDGPALLAQHLAEGRCIGFHVTAP